MEKKKVLIITAHPDDECNGMGTLIQKMTTDGHQVQLVVLTDTKWKPDYATERMQNAIKAQGIQEGGDTTVGDLRRVETINASTVSGMLPPIFMGEDDAGLVNDKATAKRLEDKLTENGLMNVDCIFTLFPADTHPDHSAVAGLVSRIFRKVGTGIPIIYFEVCSSGRGVDGQPPTIRTQTHNFYPHFYVPVSEEDFDKRCKMQNCHISQDPLGMQFGSLSQMTRRAEEAKTKMCEAYALDNRSDMKNYSIEWLNKYWNKTDFVLPSGVGATPSNKNETIFQ